MIPLSLGHMLLAYAGGLAVLILLIWQASMFFRWRRERRERRQVVHCMFCGTLYASAANEPLPTCPQCARPNERTPPASV